MEINVVRGAQSLPITQVPRVQKDDVIKMKLLDEAVGGIRPSESYWDWTFLVAFVNPNRRNVAGQDKQQAVSQEIRFKKSGWYRQYSFQVPYDSQPVFFLYPKPNYRSKILKVVTRNYNEVRKLGDKTIEIAGAYSQISSFLNELQFVLYQTQTSRYYNMNGVLGFGGGSFYALPGIGGTGGTGGGIYNPHGGSTYNPYSAPTPTPTPTPYNPYGSSSYNPYNPYYPSPTPTPTPAKPQPQKIEIPVNYNYLVEQSIERMARAFNLQLPACWGTGPNGYNSSYGSYSSSYGGSSYSSPYSSTYGVSSGSYNSYGSYGNYGLNNQNNFGYAISQELLSRAQCVAKNIRLEDFDLSVASMLQQGGIMLATYLRDKYPQLSYWINLAATAIDFIVKVFQKAALRIVPTIIQTSDGSNSTGNGNTYQTSYATQNSYSSSFTSLPNSTSTSSSYGVNPSTNFSPSSSPSVNPSVKISLFAESQPDNLQFVTAYPVVVHKWQQEPDPEVISLPPPVLAEPCLHVGVNILKNTMIGEEPEADTFTRDFKLTITAANGFKKEFPLKKNIGLGGWELNLTKEDLNSFPKIEMTLQSQISGTRGFNEIKSPPFVLPLSLGGSYKLKIASQKAFSVGGKRLVTIRNLLGSCQCLQAIIYKPSFGGQFVFDANSKDRSNQLQYSPDGKEVSFEIDTAAFQPGAGELILIIYGGEQITLNLKLYPPAPNIINVKMARGDNQALIVGERLEQLRFVKINGRTANPISNSLPGGNSQVVNFSSNQSIPSDQQQNSFANQPTTNYSNQYQFPSQNIPQNKSSSFQQNQVSENNQGMNIYRNNPGVLQNNQSGAEVNLQTNVSPNNVFGKPSLNERIVSFDDPGAKLTENMIVLELGLEDDRQYLVEKTFTAAPSRPAVIASREKEIEAIVVNSSVQVGSGKRGASTFDLRELPVLLLETPEISFNVQNALTDYDFKAENLSIETRLENSRQNPGFLPEISTASFEVLDWKNLRLSFVLNADVRKLLGGRRLQFRIRDSERGDSDWYTVKQSFVRLPEIKAVRCTAEMNGMCELIGEGIDYIAQVSVDGGRSWYPSNNNTLQAEPTLNNLKKAMIPIYMNKKDLMIKLRDFPQMKGLSIINYTFANTLRNLPKTKMRP